MKTTPMYVFPHVVYVYVYQQIENSCAMFSISLTIITNVQHVLYVCGTRACEHWAKILISKAPENIYL